MNHSQIDLQPLLLSTERRLEILRQNLLSQLTTQPGDLSPAIKQLRLIKSEFQKVLSTLSPPRDELISVLHHEFLTPLTPIQGALQLLAARRFDSGAAKVQPLLKVAFKQTNQLIAIVRELLAYEQMKSGQLKIVPQPCSVASLVQQAAQVILLNRKKTRVLFSVKPEFVTIWADPHYTILLLSHLLSNAIKFSPTRSRVTLKARLNESGASQLVLFHIQDRGIGMTPDQLEKIFDCFYQVDPSDSRPYNGLGLGLALSHQIIQLHGGQLWVESSLGVGSTFNFTLPVLPPVLDWWVEIYTNHPQCTYYFGPFETAVEARDLTDGYLEDLRREHAQIITVAIKQCQPEHLTICGSAEME